MKKVVFLVSFCLCNILSGQIKIGDNPQNINPSSVLELESNERVLVITRINTSQMNSIIPSAGALVYNTDVGCVFFYDGISWANLCETFGLSFTADPLVNPISTIVITENGNNRNFEVGEITGNNIVDFSIGGIDIQNNSISAEKLSADSVGSEELQDNTVGDAEINYNEVTLNDFTNDAGYITGANIVSSELNNSIIDNNGAYYDDSLLQNNIAANTAAIAADEDTDATNEIQNLQLTANTLQLTNANSVDLRGVGSDEQDLTAATLSPTNILQIDIENGASASVDLSSLSGTGTDNQNLTGASLSPTNVLQIDIEDGNSAIVDLSSLSGTGSDDQQISLTGGNVLTLENGGSVDLNPFFDNTDNQTITDFSFDDPSNVLSISLENGNTETVNLSALATAAGTDDQQLTITGSNILTLENGGTVDLNPFLDNMDTDDQTISNFSFNDLTNVITITLEGGNTQTADLSALAAAAGSDDQIATEVPFTAYTSITSPNVQGALVQLKDELDAIVTGGGGNPIDELQDLQLSGSILSLTNPATSGNSVNLDGFIDDADADPINEIQDLSLALNTLTISNNPAATPIDLSIYLDDTDEQTAALVPVTATPTNYSTTTADVEAHLQGIDAALASGGGNPTDEIQDLSLALNTLTISNNPAATPIDLSIYLDDTDEQTAALVPVTATPTNYSTTTADVEAHLQGIDAALASGGGNPTDEIQDLSLALNTLTISNNPAATPIDLSIYLDDTDEQTAALVPVTATPTNY
ncbi:hypothetical protein, partial [Eudoraea chungangensis]|uniref:hypothetical protein n=1 Tax=Eudoraea chungangensis TaxID=1481905 RepID=UPI0023EAE6A8